MTKSTKDGLRQRALAAVRDYGVELTLYRNAISDWAGVNVTDMECLRFLFFKGTATPTQLARHTGLTSGAATAMLDRLEKAALIERHPNPDDRRGTLIVPAKTARERAAQWFAPAKTLQDDFLAARSATELQIIADFLEGLTKIWQEERRKLREES